MIDTNLPADGERFLPEFSGVIRLEHLHRYYLARELAIGGDVLDIACGEGYGSEILSASARSVIGVDINAAAIAHARATYERPGLTFREGAATAIPVGNYAVDLIVSFETIEHLAEHEEMMAELKRVLRPGGLLLISSPNKAIYSDRAGYKNPFHVRELYTRELTDLLDRHFAHTRHYGQKTTAASVIASADGGMPMLTYTDAGSSPAVPDQRYDIVLASDGPLPDLPNSVYEISGSPLQPEQSEIVLAQQEAEIAKLLEGNAHLRAEYNQLQGERVGLLLKYDQLLLKYDRLLPKYEDVLLKYDHLLLKYDRMNQAAKRLAEDANAILQDKWWKRTYLFRKLSNSIRKKRGKPKKVWPRHFTLDTYVGEADAPSRPRLLPSMCQRCRPHVTVVSMARNEAVRASDIMRHFCALFDRVVVIDHHSDDDTAAIVARHDGHQDTEVVVLRGEDPGYYQSEYMTAVARALISEGRTDWIFFLDFDEFLPFPDARTFRQALVPLASFDVIHSHWCNLALEEFTGGSLEGVRAQISPKASTFVKIALNVPQLADRTLIVAQGSHAVLLDGTDRHYIGERAFGLFHVPIASEAAFRRKVEQGTRAYDATKGHNVVEGSHWREMNAVADRLMANPDLAREVALRYGEPVADVIADVEACRLTTAQRPLVLDFARTDPAPEAGPASQDIATFTLESIDAVLAERFQAASHKEPSRTIDSLAQAVYETLPDRTDRLAPEGRETRVRHAMLAAATELEVIVRTAWSGHMPFLFSLMEVMRPRRYVELGTHAGGSFFVACQHIKSNGHYGEAVAIDLWEGDHQAGFYDESVFENFKHLLNRHFPGAGHYLRGYFKDAVKAFRPGSIDLLHIDGLHTYEAVREDYQTWKSRVSPNGTIIFHDTSEYQTDFGVWQLFEEVEAEATAAFRFLHCHGLGVMAFGDPALNPAIELIEHFNTEPEIVENYYATLGVALFQSARMALHGDKS